MSPAYPARLLPEAQQVCYRTHEARHLVGLARPDVMVTEREHRDFHQAEAFDELLDEHQLAVKARVLLGEGSVRGWTTFDAVIDYADDAAEPASPHPNDPALLLFTSGTTSSPNGAVYPHRTLIAEFGAFLASDRAAFVSDEVMNVTGCYFPTLLERTTQ